jgi:hypothetical protein
MLYCGRNGKKTPCIGVRLGNCLVDQAIMFPAIDGELVLPYQWSCYVIVLICETIEVVRLLT